jgi:hypothetical protein
MRVGRIAAAVTAALCVLAVPARAAQVGIYHFWPPNEPDFDTYEIEFFATPGENNQLTVSVTDGGSVVTFRDPGAVFLPLKPLDADEPCQTVDAHEARCTHTDPDGVIRKFDYVAADLADGVNTYAVAPGSEAFSGSITGRGIGDRIDASGMTAPGIDEYGVNAAIQAGSGGADVLLHGPATGDRVDAVNGVRDYLYCDNGNAHPAQLLTDTVDILGPGCPGATP